MPDEVRGEDLCRSVSFRVTSTDDASGDGFTIDGYAAVYDTPTRIDSWEGQFDEEIAFGAFGRSIRARSRSCSSTTASIRCWVRSRSAAGSRSPRRRKVCTRSAGCTTTGWSNRSVRRSRIRLWTACRSGSPWSVRIGSTTRARR